MMAVPLLAREQATFDRTLKVSGAVDLEVTTGSGNITVRSGAAGTITVHGTVTASDFDSLFSGESPAAAVKEVAANPPIEQTGSFVRIGHFGESQQHRGISISYELVVPPDTRLVSKTGSGSQDISGVAGAAEVSTGSGDLKLADIAGDVRAGTGSGSITMTGLRGSVRAHTGSGSIRGERIGSAAGSNSRSSAPAYDFHTGSGSIRINDIRGGLRARTGSGHIDMRGEASGDWSLTTGSGGITVRLPAQAAFELTAHSSSGSIHTNRQVTMQGSLGRHDVRGTVNGGGVRLDVSTGSGSIRIE